MKNKSFLLGLFVIISVILGACGAQEEPHTEPPHWTYEGEEGPVHWGELDPTYALCGTGTHHQRIHR